MGTSRGPLHFHSSTHEKVTADTLLSFWKESFLEREGNPFDKAQAELGRRGSRRKAQEKGLQKYRQQQEEEGEKEEEVGSKDIQFSVKGSHKNLKKSKLRPSSFIALLKACAKQKDLHTGRELHAYIISKGLFEKSISISTALVSMYCKCGTLEIAHDVFDEICIRTVVSWNALMDGYIQHGLPLLVLTSFLQMQQECVFPNAVTYVYILKACGSLGTSNKKHEVHAQLVSNKLLEIDKFVGTALVDTYTKCGSLREAEEAFDNLVVQDVASWNALISGYTHHGHGEQAIECFEQMQHEGFSPNAITFICILKACGSLGASLRGQALHAQILREGLIAKENVGNVLLAMYAKCGILAKAQEVFDGLLVQDVVSWSTLVTGYAVHFQPEGALILFEQMQQEGLSPNGVILLCILRACGSVGASHKGQEVHAKIVKEGWLTKDIRVANALVDMYVKCGAFPKAQEVFEELPARSVVLWTALIAGYAQSGKDDVAFKLYNNMIGEGEEPDSVTFTNLLNACSNGGLLDEGQMYFEVLREHYGLLPNLEHYTRMVDLFGRAGHLEKAVTLICNMPFSADLAMWHSLLGACQKWGNVKFGRWAFEHAVQLDEEDASAYVIMSNIYEAASMHQCYEKEAKGR